MIHIKTKIGIGGLYKIFKVNPTFGCWSGLGNCLICTFASNKIKCSLWFATLCFCILYKKWKQFALLLLVTNTSNSVQLIQIKRHNWIKKWTIPNSNLPEIQTFGQASPECLHPFFSCSLLARLDPLYYEEHIQPLGSVKSDQQVLSLKLEVHNMNMTRVHIEIDIIPQEISLLSGLHYQDQEEEYCKVLRSLFSQQLYLESPKSVSTEQINH